MTNPIHRLIAEPDYSNLVWHELSNLMPLIEGAKFEELRKDIKENGLKYKIAAVDVASA
jgi:hypothetical protein